MNTMSIALASVASMTVALTGFATASPAVFHPNEPAVAEFSTAQDLADETQRIIEASTQTNGEDFQRRLIAAMTGGGPLTAQEIAQTQNPNIHYAPDQRRVTNREYVYRADGKISGYRDSQEQAEYYYDPLGRRVAKKVTQGNESFTQTYLYEGTSNRILQAKGGDGSVTTYLDGQGPNDHLAESKNGVYKGYITDHLGSVLNGEVAGDSHSFGLFGEPNDPPPLSPYSSPTMYGFQGMQYEPESQKYFTANRTYDPQNGRWLSQDPIGYASNDPNYYRALGNNPLRFTDPSGLDAQFYVTPPPIVHQVVAIDDPGSVSGKTYVDFGPASGVNLVNTSPGRVNFSPDYPLWLIPTSHYSTTAQQDAKMLATAHAIADLASAGQYDYAPVPILTGIATGNAGNNCFTFGKDVCGQVCK